MAERDGIFYYHSTSKSVRVSDGGDGFHVEAASHSETSLHLSEEDLAQFSPEQLDALFPSGFFCGVSVHELAARGREKQRARKRARSRELANERGLRLIEGPK